MTVLVNEIIERALKEIGDTDKEATKLQSFMKCISIVRVSLIKEGDFPNDSKAGSAKDAAGIARTVIGNFDRECMISLMLDVKNRVNALHTISIGSLSSSIVHPREVFKAAILSNASGIILAHNHPSGELKPSQEDILLTRKLTLAGEILGIAVFDHIIVGSGEGYFSFMENGLLAPTR